MKINDWLKSGSEEVPLYEAGSHGYHTYRIPALVVSKEGTILAFCEARKNSPHDAGKIDIVVRRSLDCGETWANMQLVVADADMTCGNPCPVVDEAHGTIWLPFCKNPGNERIDLLYAGEERRSVWIMKSEDDGETWSEPVEVTSSVKKAGWTWYATGPGHGIQLDSGRLVIPCDHAVRGVEASNHEHRCSHSIYSDDHGATWHIGGTLHGRVNECAVEQLADGSLYINMRSYHGANCRAYARSQDGGLTWSDVELDQTLVEPICQAGLVRYPAKVDGGPGWLLFSNPASIRRENMTVRLSRDGGRTWPVARTLHAGPSAYSDLAVATDGTICCLYERGNEHPYEGLTLARFTLESLSDGSNDWTYKEPLT